MTTMVGRECWYTIGCLKHGVIKRQEFNPDVCWVLYDGKEKEEVAASSLVLLSIDAAIKECDELETYWRQKREQLEAEKYERDV